MKKYAIIVAGGKGERMQAKLPKQFLNIGGKPILMWTLLAFQKADKDIKLILVLPESQIELWKDLCQQYDFTLNHQIVVGGETRFHSVKNGLYSVETDNLVAVHDGVRPFVSTETINRCFVVAKEKGAAIPVIELVDSIRFVDENGNNAVDRTKFRLVQTPQVFQSSLLKKAFEQDFSPQFTDEASVVEAIGEKVFLVDGNRENIKITTPFDLQIAEVILKNN